MKFFYSTVLILNLFLPLSAQVCTGNLGENIFTDGDFGSGIPNLLSPDPGIAPGYIYELNPPPNDGEYTVTNNTTNWGAFAATSWINIGDNSSDPNGYMMVVNASHAPGLFYEQVVFNLCENTLYQFSADIINLLQIGTWGGAKKPNISFLIDGVSHFTTGDVPVDEQWHTYGFQFTTAPGQTSLTLSLQNNAPGGSGNDLAIDNISFRACGPEATIAAMSTTVCTDAFPLLLDGEIFGSQYSTPEFQWQQSTDGGLTWMDISGATGLDFLLNTLTTETSFRFKVANDLANLQNVNCHIYSNSITLSVVTSPTVEIVLLSSTCAGEDLYLDFNSTGNGIPTSLTWTGPNGLSSNDVGLIIPNANSSHTGFYQLTMTYDNGCTATDEIFVEIFEPTAMIYNSSPSLCVGGELILDGAGGIEYSWTGPNNFTSTDQVIYIPNISQSHSGIYELTVTDVNGCTDTESVSITVSNNPIASIMPLPPICTGSEIWLDVLGFGTIEWTGPNNFTSNQVVEIIPNANSSHEGLYQVTVTNAAGCTAMDEIFVDILNGPISILQDYIVCEGENITLDLMPTGLAPFTFNWSGPNGFTSTQEDVFIVNATNLDAGIYQVTTTDANGCSVVNAGVLEVLDGLSVEIIDIGSTCQGGDLILDAGFTGDPTSFNWTGPNGFTSTQSIIVIPDAGSSNSGEYQVTIVDANGCTAMDEISVDISADLTVEIVVVGQTCQGADLILDFNFTGNPTSFLWAGPNGFTSNVPFITIPNANSLNSGTYQLVVTDNSGCTAMDEASVSITDLEVQIDPPGSVCSYDANIFLTATPAGGVWGGVANEDGVISPFLLTPGIYPITYYYEDGDGCSGLAEESIEIAAPPTGELITTSDICEGETTDIVFHFSESGPFQVLFSEGNQTTLLENIFDGYSMSVTPSETTIYSILQITEYDAPFCENTEISSVTIAVNNHVTNVIDVEICEGESIFLEGAPQTTAGVYIDYFTTVNGCDSIVSTNLIILEQSITHLTEMDCDVNNTGTFTTVLTNVAGCDSTIILEVLLKENFSSDIEEIICFGDTYEYAGNIYATSGSYPTIFEASNGCDSTVTLNLTVLNFNSTTIEASICAEDEYILADSTYQLSGQYVQVLPAENGCDSTVYLNLEVREEILTVFEETICYGETFEFSDQTFSETGTYEIIFNSYLNCDSTVQLDLTVLDSIVNNTSTSICTGQTYSFGGVNYNATGNYSATFTSVDGCDSLVNLVLEVTDVLETDLVIDICEGESYLVGDSTYFTTGIFQTELVTASGCDSIVTLDLTINYPTEDHLTKTICEGDTIFIGTTPYTTTGNYTQVLIGQNSCDSTVTLDLTVLFPTLETLSAAICYGEEYVVGDSTFTEAGTFDVILIGSNGCDSTVTLDLTVLLPIAFTVSDTICHGESYSVGDSIYFETGIFETVLTGANGCDSTVILILTEFEEISTIIDTTICAGQSYLFGNEFYEIEGTYENLLTAANGCDSLVILNLTVSDQLQENLTVTICNGESFMVGNQLFFETTADSIMLETAFGCDSLVILELTVGEIFDLTIEAEICGGETFITGNSIYNTTGVFVDTLTTILGCDSIITTQLTVYENDTTNIFLTSCDINQVGEEIFLLSNQYGCDSMVIQTTALAPPNECEIVIEFTEGTPECNEATNFFGVTVETGTAPFTLNWTGPVTGSQIIDNLNETIIIEDLPAGDYTIEVTDNFGHIESFNWTFAVINSLEISANAISIFGDYQIDCFGGQTGSAAVDIVNGNGAFSYLWSNNSTHSTIENLGAGDYTVTVTDANNCTTEANVTLTEPDPIEMAFEVTDLYCFEENSGAIATISEGGQAPFSYQLNGGSAQSDGLFPGLSGGTYTLEVTDANGCNTAEIIFINVPIAVDVSLGEDMMIDLGESHTINALINLPMSALDSIFWIGMEDSECPNCLEQVITPVLTTTYTVFVMDQNGCMDQDALSVFVDRSAKVYAPNVFSPNGDGVNDMFHLFANENDLIKIKELSVFNRWGELLYIGTDLLPNNASEGWDGTFKNKMMNSGVYVWYAIIESFDGSTKIIKGDVTLMR